MVNSHFIREACGKKANLGVNVSETRRPGPELDFFLSYSPMSLRQSAMGSIACNEVELTRNGE